MHPESVPIEQQTHILQFNKFPDFLSLQP